jgi:adenylate kinase family enzyme
MRIALYGNSGSGKSTLAARLAEAHGLVHLDLDTLVWEPGKIAVARTAAAVQADLDRFLAETPRYVVEGCYGDLVERVAATGEELWFLDPGVEVCVAHCRARPHEPHKYATQEAQDAMLPLLLGWVESYYQREDACSYAEHRRIYERCAGVRRWVREVDGG